jgi:hypothetical protein
MEIFIYFLSKESMKFFNLLVAALLHTRFLQAYYCPYECTNDPLEQTYPEQNMCVLYAAIPPGLLGLPYAIYPTCDTYNTDRFSYNKRLNWYPNAIFTPSSSDEVQYVFGQCLSNQLPFFIRSGGHCYELPIPSGYIIDLRNFNNIIPDTTTNTVYVGAGCTLGNVISTLGAINYAIPTGTCPSVGVSGLALGGGIGLLVRNYGLTCDSIVSMDVVTANNQLITVSQDSYPDLFWALRGGGHNSFGIVLGYTFNMYYIPTVSMLELRWDWNPQTFSDVYNVWQQWVTRLPENISSEAVFKYKDGKARLSVNALKVGSEPFTEWESVFLSFNPSSTLLYTGDYLGAADIFASNYPFPFSKAKSKFIFKPLPQEAVDAMINWMNILQNEQCRYIAFWEVGAGNPGALANTNSAYFPRQAFGWVFGFIYWPHESQAGAALNLINQSYSQLEPYTSPFSYANLVDYALGANYLYAYYGTNVDRLIQIKNTYDPNNIFNWAQGIPLLYVPKSILTQTIQSKYCPNK